MLFKRSLFLFLTLAFPVMVIGQASKAPIIDQFFLSVNRTAESVDGTGHEENLFGFGLGASATIWKDDLINLVPGVEFHQTRYFEGHETIGHFYSYEDLTYIRNCISIPLAARVNVLRAPGLFVEGGVFWDWVISARQHGILHSAIPDPNWQVNHKYTDINEPVDLQNSLGYSVGLGCRIKSSRFDFLIKPEYRHSFKNVCNSYMEPLRSYFKLNAGIILH